MFRIYCLDGMSVRCIFSQRGVWGTGGLLELFISLPLTSSHRPFFFFDVFVFVVDVVVFDVFVFSFVVCAIGVAERMRRPLRAKCSSLLQSPRLFTQLLPPPINTDRSLSLFHFDENN